MEVGRRKIEAVFMADLDAQSEANRRLPTVRPAVASLRSFGFLSFSFFLTLGNFSPSPLGFGDLTPQSQLVLFNVPLDYPLDDLKRALHARSACVRAPIDCFCAPFVRSSFCSSELRRGWR
jgi:hypothetical protein